MTTLFRRREAPRQTPTIFHIDSSAKKDGSVSRLLSQEAVNALNPSGNAQIIRRDLNVGVPHIDTDWIAATQTAENARGDAERSALKLSEQLVGELKEADILVMGVAVYNFSIPSTLKAWIDHICRSRVTFQYVDGKPEGLLTGKQAIVVFSTGGTRIGSDIDFASKYIGHVLGFVGIDDIHMASADRLFADREAALATARQAIANAAQTVLRT